MYKINAPVADPATRPRGRGRKSAEAKARAPQIANAGAAVPRGALNWQGMVITGFVLILIGGALVVRIHIRPGGAA